MKKRWTIPLGTRAYGQRLGAEHRVVRVGHGLRPTYSRRMRRMLNRLFR